MNNNNNNNNNNNKTEDKLDVPKSILEPYEQQQQRQPQQPQEKASSSVEAAHFSSMRSCVDKGGGRRIGASSP